MGWSGKRNGALLNAAAAEFDAIVTVDKNMQHQQNLSALPVAIVVLAAMSNELSTLLPLLPKLEAALAVLQPRTFVRIEG